ncbi:hypothetical protein ACFQY0_14555 [Haloferula chungangensis]|uniref:Lipoprotein n=1 Tax=Haloferula chungangensis TaxID=1048331 RepID=A0ABW2L7S2_9BACT
MTRLIALTLVLTLSSCGLIQMPFRVVGGVTKGTAQAVRKPIDAHKERKARKEAQKAKEEAKKKREEASKQSDDHLPPELLPPSNDGNPDLEALESLDPNLPPLPSEYQDLPPIGEE